MSSPNGTFTIYSKIFPYLFSLYNNAAYNERSIEVPIALYFYSQTMSNHQEFEHTSKILEVGAVLPHYHPTWNLDMPEDRHQTVFPHLCIDQYEKGLGIVNTDIRLWEPPNLEKFDLIVSISTMEHIFDRDRVHYPDQKKIKIFRETIDTMRSWLTPGGIMMMTIPAEQPAHIGGGSWINTYLHSLQETIRGKKEGRVWNESDPQFVWKMNRMGYGQAGNVWHQVDPALSPTISYYEQIPSAGTVFFLFWGDIYKLWYR